MLGRFEITRPVRVLDLDVLTKVITDGSWFDPEFATRSNRAAFLRHLVDEISRPIMPRDEEFEYLPTQAVSEYLASCVEQRLDGIIFHSAQTAREGRNIVLFHHAAGVKPYALPEGTKVEVHMGWASEDDYDDIISVWETVPPPKPAKEKGRGGGVLSFDALLRGSRDTAAGEWDDEVFYGEPTLNLDVQRIEVFRIRGVSYRKSKRSVWRHRTPADEKPSF